MLNSIKPGRSAGSRRFSRRPARDGPCVRGWRARGVQTVPPLLPQVAIRAAAPAKAIAQRHRPRVPGRPPPAPARNRPGPACCTLHARAGRRGVCGRYGMKSADAGARRGPPCSHRSRSVSMLMLIAPRHRFRVSGRPPEAPPRPAPATPTAGVSPARGSAISAGSIPVGRPTRRARARQGPPCSRRSRSGAVSMAKPIARRHRFRGTGQGRGPGRQPCPAPGGRFAAWDGAKPFRCTGRHLRLRHRAEGRGRARPAPPPSRGQHGEAHRPAAQVPGSRTGAKPRGENPAPHPAGVSPLGTVPGLSVERAVMSGCATAWRVGPRQCPPVPARSDRSFLFWIRTLRTPAIRAARSS
jgi:hypothetical protein